MYPEVEFLFWSAKEPLDSSSGSVAVRSTEMVLDVPLPGDRPYVIRGVRKEGYYYEGSHQGLPDDVPVLAKWTRLDDIWIGTWLEDNIEYVFQFQLTDD